MPDSRYPKNWKQKSFAVRESANWCCQHCQRQCRQPKESISDFIIRTGYDRVLVRAHPRRWLLQTAHLNHDPENESAELLALCVPCHRLYDNTQMAKIKNLERERQGQLCVDQQQPHQLEGLQLPIADLAEPWGVLNGGTAAPVTSGTLAVWLEDRLKLFSSLSERQAFIRQFQSRYNPDYRSAVSALRKALPYRCSEESLAEAIAQVQRALAPVQKDFGRNGNRRRRYRMKGQASGFIDIRKGNKSRGTPSLSYYYRWDSPVGRISEYIPAGKVALVDALIESRTPAIDILKRVCEGKKQTTKRARALLNEIGENNGKRDKQLYLSDNQE